MPRHTIVSISRMSTRIYTVVLSAILAIDRKYQSLACGVFVREGYERDSCAQ